MYENFAELCEMKGVTPYRVAKDCGFSNVTLSDWKNGKSVPKMDKLQKIAEYFKVSVNYLTGKQENAFSEESAHLVAMIRNDKRLSDALLKYFKMSDQKKKHILELIDLLSE